MSRVQISPIEAPPRPSRWKTGPSGIQLGMALAAAAERSLSASGSAESIRTMRHRVPSIRQATALLPAVRVVEVDIRERGAGIGGHGVAVEQAGRRRRHWYPSEPDAKGGFVRKVHDLRATVWREPVLVQRIESERVVEAVLYGETFHQHGMALEARTDDLF